MPWVILVVAVLAGLNTARRMLVVASPWPQLLMVAVAAWFAWRAWDARRARVAATALPEPVRTPIVSDEGVRRPT